MRQKKIQFLPLCGAFALLLILSSCAHTKTVTYFNDLSDTARLLVQDSILRARATIGKGDILDIYVTSQNAQASAVFNIGGITQAPAGSASGTGTPNNGEVNGASSGRGYTVEDDGNIDFPVLGKIRAAGSTLTQLRDTIKQRLDTFLTMPFVNVRFLNYKVTILGEVSRPATYVIGSGKVSILDLLGMAGDLTIYGKRNNILVVREEEKKRTFARLDLTSSKVFYSPYYFLKQNDVVYVEPNKYKVVTANDNLMRTVSVTVSLVGLIASLLLITKL